MKNMRSKIEISNYIAKTNNFKHERYMYISLLHVQKPLLFCSLINNKHYVDTDICATYFADTF